MLRTATLYKTVGYEKFFTATEFDTAMLQKAQEIFNEYSHTGVILNAYFKDERWALSDEFSNVNLDFSINEIGFQKNASRWICCQQQCFSDCMKAYVVLLMGTKSISGLRSTVRTLKKITEKSAKELIISCDDVCVYELLELLPDSSAKREKVIAAIKENCRRESFTCNSRRVLAKFEAYFAFNERLESYYQSASQKEKIYYFPLWLWWNLTAILPLRPTEFLLTHRDCIHYTGGEYIITLRRTLQKGSGHRFAYKIDKDYKLVKYSLPERIAKEIIWYQQATEDMDKSALGTLFVARKTGEKYENRHYNYTKLNKLLKKFLSDVMGITKDTDEQIKLGDTRHLAMIGLIISGGSPVICKELAGHSNINISSHYYSNISRFVECSTYMMFKKIHPATIYERKIILKKHYAEALKVQDGKCNSLAFRNGSIEDCIKFSSGKLGDCHCCVHFIDGKTGTTHLQNSKERVDTDSRYLMQVIENVRVGLGYNEDIGSAILRLQQSSTIYSGFLRKEWEE